MELGDQVNPSKKETTSEEEKFGAIHLLHMSDPVIYENLSKEFQNGSYVGRDEYRTTYGGSYELMLLRSVIYQ